VIELKTNNKQATLLSQTCGCNRKAYNVMLDKAVKDLDAGIKFNKFAVKKWFNGIKGDAFPYMKEVNAHAVANDAIDRLDNAMTRFFKKTSKFPKLHTRKQGQSFSLSAYEVRYDESGRVYIPRIGWINLTERLFVNRRGELRYELKRLFRVTVSSRAGRWFCSFQCEVEDRNYCENQAIVGIDVGIKELATCWDGEKTLVYHNPRTVYKLEKQKRKLNKELSRSKRGGKNRKKIVKKLQRLYLRESSLRADNLHKLTTGLSHQYETIGLEKLNVAGMLKNRKLAKAIQDCSFGELQRQFTYKAGLVVDIPTFYPSSKLCSCCGEKKPTLFLSERTFVCPTCGFEIDRDLNAARNIFGYAEHQLESVPGGAELAQQALQSAG
jgi:putative transposase